MSDFDKIVDRRNTNSLKWDVNENELPMWVADMDFETAPCVKRAVERRAASGVFGYTVVPDEWFDAYIGWWKNRHGFTIEREWLVFCTGVVPAISSIVRKLSTPAEKVIIQPPVYNIFYNSILNNGRVVLENPLKYDGKGYCVDFEDLERKLADPQATLMILCNPHNPVGKIHDKGTLRKIGDLAEKYHVTIVSDEIHCDLTAPQKNYTPFASVDEICRGNSITCVAPTKAFNIAGLQTAAVIIPDEALRHRVVRALNTDEIAEPNAFAIDAAVAAFTEGGGWLDELRGYIERNKAEVCDFAAKKIPQISVVRSDATYLLWLDCTKIHGSAREISSYIRRKTGLYLSEGGQFGCGKHFLRMNVACPRSVLLDGLNRLESGISAYESNFTE